MYVVWVMLQMQGALNVDTGLLFAPYESFWLRASS